MTYSITNPMNLGHPVCELTMRSLLRIPGSYEVYKREIHERFPDLNPSQVRLLAALLGDVSPCVWLSMSMYTCMHMHVHTLSVSLALSLSLSLCYTHAHVLYLTQIHVYTSTKETDSV